MMARSPSAGKARIGVTQTDLHSARLAPLPMATSVRAFVPRGEHTQRCRLVFHGDLGAQLVEVETLDQRCADRAGNIEKEAAAKFASRFTPLCGRCFGHKEIGNDLALRREQSGKPRRRRREREDVGGDEAVQKIARIVAGKLDHAAIREKGSLHAINA